MLAGVPAFRRSLAVIAPLAAALLAIAPNAGAAAPRCTADMLTARVTAPAPGAGQRQAALVLTNRAASPCSTRGYVGLQLTGAGGRAIPTQAVRTGAAAAPVTLAPGATARATLQWTVMPAGSEPVDGPCEATPRRLLVIPPNGTRQLAARWTQGPVCQRGRFLLSPLHRAIGSTTR
jgi:hypothetical protein